MVRHVECVGLRGRCATLVAVVSLLGLVSLASAADAAATVQFVGSPGTGGPPKRIDGIKMRRFRRDHRRLFGVVTTVKGPTGKIAFSVQARHLRVRNVGKRGYWRTWSNHYRGDVYWVTPAVTISLPAGTTAFYFYAEPNDHGSFKVTATTTGATSGPLSTRGKGGAKFFGFVATGGEHLTTITVSSDDPYRNPTHPGGFAIGEFGIN